MRLYECEISRGSFEQCAPKSQDITVRYHGLLASRSKHRADIVTEDAAVTLLYGLVAFGQIRLRKVDGHQAVAGLLESGRIHYSWSELMRRVFEIDVLQWASLQRPTDAYTHGDPSTENHAGNPELARVTDPRATDRPGQAP